MQHHAALRIACGDGTFVQPDGVAGPENTALSIKFRLHLTGMDIRRIERLSEFYSAEIDGSTDEIGSYLDRQRAQETYANHARARLLSAIGADAWERQPNDTDESLEQRRQDAIIAQWDTCQDPEFIRARERWSRLYTDNAEIAMWARWQVTQVDAPEGWQVIQDRPDYGRLRPFIVASWQTFVRASEEGKG